LAADCPLSLDHPGINSFLNENIAQFLKSFPKIYSHATSNPAASVFVGSSKFSPLTFINNNARAAFYRAMKKFNKHR